MGYEVPRTAEAGPRVGGSEAIPASSSRQPQAVVIVNADDWALNARATNRIFECAQAGAVSSVSAMVFMDDSERAAGIAREHAIDTGIHLNLTCGFTAAGLPLRLHQHHQRVIAFLRFRRYARGLFNPLLAGSFEYVVRAQMDEYARLYGAPPLRVDGHHHMHLCANVRVQKLLPGEAIVRRIESFAPGEKSALDRWYRRRVDRRPVKRFRMPDYYFSLLPIEPARMRHIVELARRSIVEIGAHPDRDAEYRYLMNGELAHSAENVALSRGYRLRSFETYGLDAPGAAAGKLDRPA